MTKQTSLVSGKINGQNHNSTSSENVSAKKVTADANRRCKVVPMKMAFDTTTTTISKKQGNENGNGVAGDENDEADDDDDDDNDNGDGNASINNTTTSASGKHTKLNRQSSAETSIDDVNNKLTSHAFQSYDEQMHLEESKEIKSPITENIPN